MFKKLKRETKREKENSIELQMPKVEAEVYNNKKFDWGKNAEKFNWIT